MNNIKKLIIIFIILIIVVLGLLLYILKKDNIENNYYDNSEYLQDGGEIISDTDEDGFVDVKDDSIFFSVFNSVERYIDILQY